MSDKNLNTPLDDSLVKLFGHGQRGSIFMLTCIVTIWTSMRFITYKFSAATSTVHGIQDLPLTDFLTTQTNKINSPDLLFFLHLIEETLIFGSAAIILIKQLIPKATLKLQLVTFAVVANMVTTFWLTEYPVKLGFNCVIYALALLSLDCPLMASVPMILAFNLELSYLFLIPVFMVYAVCSIINNAPLGNLVKKIDYILWKIIFLTLNFILLNMLIWWQIITPEDQTRQTTSN